MLDGDGFLNRLQIAIHVDDLLVLECAEHVDNERVGDLLEDVLLKGIKLPPLLTDAIELKAQAEQASAAMEFKLSKVIMRERDE